MTREETVPITVEYPDAGDLALHVMVGACRVFIGPSQGEHWVEGTYADPTRTLPLNVTQEGGAVTLTQGPDLTHLPHPFAGVPTLKLGLGAAKPFALTLDTGAGENECELGNLPLVRLTVREGAVTSRIDFSAPNPVRMALLEVNAGAAGLTLKNLANSGATLMTLQGGAAAYEFDFGGTLRDDAEIKIATGMSSLVITVPDTVAAKISVGEFLGRLTVGSGFTRQAGAYWSQAAAEGKSPVLVIDSKVALGSIELRASGVGPALRANAAAAPA